MKQFVVLLLFGLLAAPAAAQGTGDLRVIFESDPGFRLSALLDSATVGFRHRADFNLDGTPDLTLLSVDEQDNPVGINTIDAASLDTLWRFQYGEIAGALGTSQFRFMGFFTFRPDGPRQAIFRSRNALALIATVPGKQGGADFVVLPARRFALLDLSGDGAVEAIVQNPETGTVQVYGTDTGTAVEAEIEAALARLGQNYPNPFREATTINYEVEHAAPVTLAVYDLLGRRVRTLVDERQGPGAHRAVWDGRDASGRPVASGTYFYRLRVGEAVTSKQALRIR